MPLDELIRIFLPSLGLLAVPVLAWHILMAVALQSIAKRRGLWWRWLAWFPIGQNYVLGAIADDIAGSGGYRVWRNGEEIKKESYFRYILSGYQIIIAFIAVILAVKLWRGEDISGLLLGGLFNNALYDALAPVVSFALAGVHAYALYKIFGYYRPERASLYTVLCVFFAFLTPFLLLSVRKAFPRQGTLRHEDYFPPVPRRDDDEE